MDHGKTSRRTHGGREPLHLVSAWAGRQRLVRGQQATDAASNEDTAIPLLLERLALTGALVTIDAIGCQTKIAQAILAQGADDLLAVKANRPALHDEVARYFADVPTDDLDRFTTTDGDHGRIEIRRHAVSCEVAWLATNRRFPGAPRFPGLAAIAMVEAEIERDGKVTLARRYFLSSALLDARLFARAVRSHWHIENRLPWTSSSMTSAACAWSRPAEHGRRQAHGHEPRAHRFGPAQLQAPPQESGLERCLPGDPPATNRVTPIKRSPWASAAGAHHGATASRCEGDGQGFQFRVQDSAGGAGRL